jgi:hypothetical protein
MPYSVKQKMGVILLDWLRYEKGLRHENRNSMVHYLWVDLCNRNEKLERAPEGPGVKCLWKWTSDLHAPKVFPSLGIRLMKRAFEDWPVVFRDEPLSRAEGIEVSFVIGHRGIDRLQHLLMTLSTIASQRALSCECIVVEQSAFPEIKDALPPWVRYVHTPLPYPDMPYCRSWAFNVGGRAAQGRILVLHDNDMLIPQDYAAQILERWREGYEVINLERFIFYLSKPHSEKICSSKTLELAEAPETVVQNLEAGGSIAIGREAYFRIGGFDESFIGWGGEDNEFWERAQTRKVWPYGYLPLIHLWHKAQAGKTDQKRATVALFEERSRIPAEARIKELSFRTFGDPLRLTTSDIIRADGSLKR